MVGAPYVCNEEVRDGYGFCTSCDADAPLPGLKELFLFVTAVLSAPSMRCAITLRDHSPTWIGRTDGVDGWPVCGGGVVGLCNGGVPSGESGWVSYMSSKSLSTCFWRRGVCVDAESFCVFVVRVVVWCWRVHVAMASPPWSLASSSFQSWIHMVYYSSSAPC